MGKSSEMINSLLIKSLLLENGDSFLNGKKSNGLQSHKELKIQKSLKEKLSQGTLLKATLAIATF